MNVVYNCLSCYKEIVPLTSTSRDFCSPECEIKKLRLDMEDLRWFLKHVEEELNKINLEYRSYRKGVQEGYAWGITKGTEAFRDHMNTCTSNPTIVIKKE